MLSSENIYDLIHMLSSEVGGNEDHGAFKAAVMNTHP